MIKQRNRSEGWTFAKLSGHKNETRLAKLINKNAEYRNQLQKRLNIKEEIINCKEGGIFEKNIKDIFGKTTKRKTDLILNCKNNIFVNISLKKKYVLEIMNGRILIKKVVLEKNKILIMKI